MPRYYVTADHTDPAHACRNLLVTVGKSSQGPNKPARWYANAPGYGCGKDADTPRDAIALLLADHACTVISIGPAPEEETRRDTRCADLPLFRNAC